VVEFYRVKWAVYIEILFEIHCINIPHLSSKIAKVLEYLEKTVPEADITHREFKRWIECMEEPSAEGESSMARMLVKMVNKKEIKQCKRKLIAKAFNCVFGISSLEHSVSTKQPMREFSHSEHEVSKLVTTL
jgi:hypothetical protein